MKKVYFSKSFRNSHGFEVSANFDIMQFVKILTRQGKKNKPVNIKGVSIWNFQISRDEYKNINELQGVEIVPTFNYLLN